MLASSFLEDDYNSDLRFKQRKQSQMAPNTQFQLLGDLSTAGPAVTLDTNLQAGAVTTAP